MRKSTISCLMLFFYATKYGFRGFVKKDSDKIKDMVSKRKIATKWIDMRLKKIFWTIKKKHPKKAD